MHPHFGKSSRIRILVVCLLVVSAGGATAGTTVVTPPGDTHPPLGFFSVTPTVVDFDASVPDGGIPAGITMQSGKVMSTEHPGPFPPHWYDYAEDSPTSNVVVMDGHTGVIISFEGAIVPREVGVVLTDAPSSGVDVVFEAWSGPGSTGQILTSVTAFRGNDGTNNRNFGDDCFFGIKDAGEIKSIRLWYDVFGVGGIEMDMLRLAVPEPATLSLLALGGLALLRRRRKRLAANSEVRSQKREVRKLVADS